jgi:ubiquinone biosynthesis protein
VFLIKAITTIESVGERLAPDFDIVAHVQPYVRRLVQRRYGFRAVRKRLQETLLGYADLLETLPAQVRSILQGLRRSRITINLEHRGLDRLTETIDRSSGHIAHSVFVGSLVMGSAILILADTVTRERGLLTVIAGITFVTAIALAAWRAIYSWMK